MNTQEASLHMTGNMVPISLTNNGFGGLKSSPEYRATLFKPITSTDLTPQEISGEMWADYKFWTDDFGVGSMLTDLYFPEGAEDITDYGLGIVGESWVCCSRL